MGVKELRTQEDVPVRKAPAPTGLRAYAGFSGLAWANGLPAESRVCVPWLVPENETCDMWSRPDGMHGLEPHMAGATQYTSPSFPAGTCVKSTTVVYASELGKVVTASP